MRKDAKDRDNQECERMIHCSRAFSPSKYDLSF